MERTRTMPTAGRFASAVVMMFMAIIVSALIIPLLPEGKDVGYFAYINAFIGFCCGWVVTGGRLGRGVSAAMSNGFTGMLAVLFFALTLQALNEMMIRAMDLRYKGLSHAISGFADLVGEFALLLATPDILGTLLFGSMLAGFAGEMAARRWR